MPPGEGRHHSLYPFLFAFFVLANLVSYSAAGLAGRLTRSLALAAAAVFRALAKIAGADRLYSLHNVSLRNNRFVVL